MSLTCGIRPKRLGLCGLSCARTSLSRLWWCWCRVLVWPWLVPDSIENLQLAHPSLGNTKASCTMYRVHRTECRGTQTGREEEKKRGEGESRAVLSGNGDVVSGREWGNMAAGEVGLDAAGSASGRPPVGHRCVTG